MILCLISAGILLAGGLAALLVGSSPRLSMRIGAMSVVAGAAVGLVAAFHVLLGGGVSSSIHLPWSMPMGSFSLELDGLSAFFLVPILLVSAVAAVYGLGYFADSLRRRSLAPMCFFYNLLVASMVFVVLARNGVLFLMAWEVMSLASFFLVTHESDKPGVRDAGWIYLIATHLGTMFLLVFFILMGRTCGSWDFDQFTSFATAAPELAGLAFILAVIGFGTKAGFVPLHVWLPEAHPAAPSHVSAVMSGVMIKTGIYGLVRMLPFLGPPPMWWGWLLVAIGISSGILGVLFALAQHDLKRLLAYHSVENIGIIALGLGVGLLGTSSHIPALAVLGFAGALLHVLNHALFKGLLFLGAGSVLHGTHTAELERLGGLLKRMPWTGVTFLVGAAAIVGLPPLNGFVSEFLIYLGAFKGTLSGGLGVIVASLGVLGGLALIGGLALACFTKAFGIVFLGEPRTEEARSAHEANWPMRVAMLILAAGCVLVGLGGPVVVSHLTPALGCLAGLDGPALETELAVATLPLIYIAVGLGIFALVVTLLVIVRRGLLASREVTQSETWGCGYAQPTPRMQYTASSFAQPLMDTFKMFLHTSRHADLPQELFPAKASMHTETLDAFRRRIYQPAFQAISRLLERMRQVQHGHIQLYVLYIAAALLVLLVWKLR